MAWVKFISKARQRDSSPTLSIWKKGQLCLNKRAVSDFNLQKSKYVVLYMDVQAKRIGVKPIDSFEEGALKLRAYKWGDLVWAQKFSIQYGLNGMKYRQLPCEWDDDEKMIVARYQK